MSQHDAPTNDMDHTAQTTPIETFLDESDTTRATESAPAAAAYQPPQGPQTAQHPVPEFKSGPAPVTSVVGFLGLLTAIAVLVTQATDLDIPWGVVGPVAVVGAGVLLVVLGLAGLRGQRFRG
jgi:protein-S-isoprenylcysteine O-methyltransferase Ste14